MTKGVLLILLPWLLTLCGRLEAGLNWGWVPCRCKWDEWNAWSDCTSDCFGTRVRDRKVWLWQYNGCDAFTDCATVDMGKDQSVCNNVCHNGGSLSGSRCYCSPGYTGRCCMNQINCGKPDDIIHGHVTYSSTYYGSAVTYGCHTNYNVTGASTTRTCQLSGAWNGTKPRCVFVNHCASHPCHNNGTCTDLLDDYECTCMEGWGGTNCQKDIQPPEMTGCSSNVTVFTNESMKDVNWTEPTFTDPMGNVVNVVKNYNSPGFNFSWDDFTVQYVATKRSNGLQTECRFTISVRPNPCPDLNIPLNGARICNGWKRDFGQYCIIACQSGYTIPSMYQYETIYVCGASGQWIAPAPAPDCNISMSNPANIVAMQPAYSAYSYNTTCTDPAAQASLSSLYMNTITNKNSFSEVCTSFPDHCSRENVQIDC